MQKEHDIYLKLEPSLQFSHICAVMVLVSLSYLHFNHNVLSEWVNYSWNIPFHCQIFIN